jgi:hypothetical protein
VSEVRCLVDGEVVWWGSVKVNKLYDQELFVNDVAGRNRSRPVAAFLGMSLPIW